MKKLNFLKLSVPFIPLLIIYLSVSFFLSKDQFYGDEGRYIQFSKNLLNGFYANPDLSPGFLWNGPGYPIVLTPFIFFEAPLILPKLLNVLFVFLGVIFFYKSLSGYISIKKSIVLSYLVGLSHPFTFRSISLIFTEGLSFFLVCTSLYIFIQFSKNKKVKTLFAFGFLSGFLILTKVFFSYVFLTLGIITFLVWILKKFSKESFQLVKLTLLTIFLCLPYLIYTYSITGKMFYWADSGGSSLYSMSTPYENEYGDWFPPNADLLINNSSNSFTVVPKQNTLSINHHDFLKSLEGLNGIEKDNELKKKSLENINNNKLKFIKNIIFNFGRMAFRYPFTDKETIPILQIVFVIHFSLFFLPFLISVFLILKKPQKEFIHILLFLMISLIGLLPLSSGQRFTFPLTPLFFFILSKIIINFQEKYVIDNRPCLQ